jgi:hypothetical protein
MAKHCGAKNRKGGSCKQAAMLNGRCRYHGGLSTGPKDTTNSSRNSLKHGIYASFLTDEEVELSQAAKLGNVEDELRLARIRLRRALGAEQLANGQPELDEVIERDIDSKIGARREEKHKVREYTAIIDRLMARVESLEKTRLILRTVLGIDPEDMDADKLTPGAPDEATPTNPIR